MKIIKIRVTDEHGVEHEFEGIEGYLRFRHTTGAHEQRRRMVETFLVLSAEHAAEVAGSEE